MKKRRSASKANTPPPEIAPGLFDNPVALLWLAQERGESLQMALHFCDAHLWIPLFDFAMAVNALSDWVSNARPDLKTEVKALSKNLTMGAWRDIANSGKHVSLDRSYGIREIGKTDHLPKDALNSAGLPDEKVWRLSVKLDDGTSRYMEDLVDDVLKLWCSFFERHNLEDP